jgi:hypothetical protein
VPWHSDTRRWMFTVHRLVIRTVRVL